MSQCALNKWAANYNVMLKHKMNDTRSKNLLRWKIKIRILTEKKKFTHIHIFKSILHTHAHICSYHNEYTYTNNIHKRARVKHFQICAQCRLIKTYKRSQSTVRYRQKIKHQSFNAVALMLLLFFFKQCAMTQ